MDKRDEKTIGGRSIHIRVSELAGFLLVIRTWKRVAELR